MPTPQPNPAAYFRAVIADPKAAEDELERWDDDHQQGLRAVAAQQAIRSAYPTPLKPTEVRSLTSRMRRLIDEPIDSFIVATIIDAFFAPESDPVVRRLDTIPVQQLRRMMLLLPYGIFSGAVTPLSDDDTEAWIDNATHLFATGMQAMSERFGTDLGAFYRDICTNPAQAYKALMARTDIDDIHKCAMVYNAAFGALHMMYGNDGPSRTQRDALLADMHHMHGDELPADALDNIIHGAFAEDADWPENDARIPVALLLPKTMVTRLNYNLADIANFMRTCTQTEREVGPIPD